MLESGAASPFSVLAGTLWNSNHRRKVFEICTNFKWWPRFGQAWNSHSCKQRRLKRKYYPQIWGIFYFQIQTILHISIKLVFTTLLSCISSPSHWQRRILAKVIRWQIENENRWQHGRCLQWEGFAGSEVQRGWEQNSVLLARNNPVAILLREWRQP